MTRRQRDRLRSRPGPPPPARAGRAGAVAREATAGGNGENASAFRALIALAALGAVSSALAPLVGVVSGLEPGFASWPLLAVLALLPPALAAGFLARGRELAAAGVLAAPAALVPGRLLLDAQIVADPTRTARPELFVPTSLVPPGTAPGWGLLLVGQLAVGVAGLLALRLVLRATASPADATGRRERPLTPALCVGGFAAAGLALSPFASDNAFLWPQSLVDAPAWTAVGGLLVALAVPLTAAVTAGADDPEVAEGGLLGVAFGVAGVAAPPLVAALAMPAVHVLPGPVIALVAAVALGALGRATGRAAGRSASARRDPSSAPGEVVLPGAARLHALAGGLALASGLAALVSPLLPQLSLPTGLAEPANYAARPLLPAGALVAALGVALLVRSTSAAARPALAVAWTAVPLTAVAALDGVLTATDLPGVRAGFGAWAAGLAALLAVAAGCCAALAGGVERDDVDLTALSVHRPLLVVAVLVSVLALGAFGLPLTDAPGYAAPGVWTQFRAASWGLLLGLLAVPTAMIVAARSRPARAAALALGASGLVCVRLLELPLTAGRVDDVGPAAGFWCGLACLALLLTGAAMAGSGARRSPRRGVTR
ncbi:hypothetical protein LX15_005296 [Streptoalloteichus tenebrarius]|uniref:Integral membrane protein n=1 Tax=Streptoalloteichus tenebrarius (strain ATCC 17920 / DSM 40477 / JCM 4838 / CBS 697.72 / NBRC 16177 / NCIMB 11028 / NRRL B-12390 / A12253. 1 / ISP 5477) TaxID=1933 RepID=A0ABT1I1B3_STRSD|nr:hypothetical protein [Streptoalloteichus tenebrarius]